MTAVDLRPMRLQMAFVDVAGALTQFLRTYAPDSGGWTHGAEVAGPAESSRIFDFRFSWKTGSFATPYKLGEGGWEEGLAQKDRKWQEKDRKVE